MITKNNRESLIWKGIRKTWDVLMEGCSWKLGKGDKVRFWRDRWLLSGHCLMEIATQEVPLDLRGKPVSHFYDVGRGWKLYLFAQMLPDRFLQEILSLHAPYERTDDDALVWSGCASGNFSTRSAYDMIAGSPSREHD